MISQIAGGITGLIAGAITGICAIPRSLYTLLQYIKNGTQDWPWYKATLLTPLILIGAVICTGFLLGFSLLHVLVRMAIGIKAGASQGFLAGLNFPWTRYDDHQKEVDTRLIAMFLRFDHTPTQTAQINPRAMPVTNPTPFPPPVKLFSGRSYSLVDSKNNEPTVQPDISELYGSNPLLTEKIDSAKKMAKSIPPKLKLLEPKEMSRLYSKTREIYKSYADSTCPFSKELTQKLKDPITLEWTHHYGVSMFATVSCSELEKLASSSESVINIKGKNLRDNDVICYMGFVKKEAFEPITPPPNPIGTLTF